MRKVYIMRGIPGSGKSTYVQTLRQQHPKSVIVSADDYFVRDGVYTFNPEGIRAAHDSCLSSFVHHLMDQTETIIVDNTNLHAWEIAPYYRMAEIYEYVPCIQEMQAPLELCMTRQTHDVPETTIARMWNTLQTEKLPPWWKIEFRPGV